jgi:hypothetical protein
MRSVKKQQIHNLTFTKPSGGLSLAQTVAEDVESEGFAQGYSSSMQDYTFCEEDVNTMTRDAVLHSRITREKTL